MTKQKNKWIAVILALLLGTFGIHRFYLGHTGTGILMLVLGISFIGLWISGIWAIIDIVRILTGNLKDKEGRDLVE